MHISIHNCSVNVSGVVLLRYLRFLYVMIYLFVVKPEQLISIEQG